jgi:hypothetical protein
MNSEILSASVLARQASAHPLAAITADPRMHLQDQRNSGDVVLKSAGSGKLKHSQRKPKCPVSVAVPSGTRVRGEPARAA